LRENLTKTDLQILLREPKLKSESTAYYFFVHYSRQLQEQSSQKRGIEISFSLDIRSMTVSAEILAGFSVWFSVGIGMTGETVSRHIIMPIASNGFHKSDCVCFGIRSFDAIGISMTRNTGWIAPFCIMT